MRVGIFFGGPSREREISFAGGRTVYDNLNKALFDPVAIFVDSHQRFIRLDWEYVYKGTIRDFYPPIENQPKSKHDFQIYIESLGQLSEEQYNALISKVGQEIPAEALKQHMDVAFLALHGYFGEDGLIQAVLERQNIPYTGSGIRASSIGMDKSVQKKMMQCAGFHVPKMCMIPKRKWSTASRLDWYETVKTSVGFPLVIRPANQGSSIGVSILMEDEGADLFYDKIDAAFFKKMVAADRWNALSESDRVEEVREIIDIRGGLGFPLDLNGTKIEHPDALLEAMEVHAVAGKDMLLEAYWTESKVLVESFIHGREFSCIVLRDEQGVVRSLPPTEIVKQTVLYDYKSKYLPGLSRKVTPIDLPSPEIDRILSTCADLFDFLDFQTYARIDGFYGDDGHIYLNDPNTTSGMMPASFFFHQAAEIGLNPSQFLSLIIRNSIQERCVDELYGNTLHKLLQQLDQSIETLQASQAKQVQVAVIFGGYSFERHISVESGRNIYEKLSSSSKYNPVPIFLLGDESGFKLYKVPISLMLKDNADDIRDKILNYKVHPIIQDIQNSCVDITTKYASEDAVAQPVELHFEDLANQVDCAFIALHGRPGEDGNLQQALKKVGIPYNGSDWESAHITIDKYATLQTLKEHGFTVAEQFLLEKSTFTGDLSVLTERFDYPFILKPVDDGCSSAVQMIKHEEQLKAYLQAIFRGNKALDDVTRTTLNLGKNEEFPSKTRVLCESLIQANDADHFLEITGGLLTSYDAAGTLQYEMFEPSEALSSGEVLSLEEKFLAGEGQNITPARFATSGVEYHVVAKQVKSDLERAARILGVKGYARIDAFVRIYNNNRAETIIIEVNSLPGMTPATCIFHQCAINGYKPYEFIDKILEFAMHE